MATTLTSDPYKPGLLKTRIISVLNLLWACFLCDDLCDSVGSVSVDADQSDQGRLGFCVVGHKGLGCGVTVVLISTVAKGLGTNKNKSLPLS